MVRKFFIFLLYCLFALCITGVFLVILFPRERISAWVATSISSKMPGYECSIDDIRYVHPLKIRFYQVTFVNKFQGITIPIDTLLLSFPATFPIEKVGLSGVVFGGDMSGDARLDNLNRSGKVDIENLDISQVYLGDIGMIRDGVDRSLQGLLSFSGRASFKPKQLDSFRFTGEARVRKFTTTLRRPIFSKNDLSFDDVTADVSFSSGVLQLSGGQAVGQLLNGDFNGTVKTAALWRNRMLDINGNVVPQPDLLQDNPKLAEALDLYHRRYNTRAIPYKITGTLRDPEIRFSGSPALEAAQTN